MAIEKSQPRPVKFLLNWKSGEIYLEIEEDFIEDGKVMRTFIRKFRKQYSKNKEEFETVVSEFLPKKFKEDVVAKMEELKAQTPEPLPTPIGNKEEM